MNTKENAHICLYVNGFVIFGPNPNAYEHKVAVMSTFVLIIVYEMKIYNFLHLLGDKRVCLHTSKGQKKKNKRK